MDKLCITKKASCVLPTYFWTLNCSLASSKHLSSSRYKHYGACSSSSPRVFFCCALVSMFYVRLQQIPVTPSDMSVADTIARTQMVFFIVDAPRWDHGACLTNLLSLFLYQSTWGFKPCWRMSPRCVGLCNTAEECMPVIRFLHCYFHNKSTFLSG